MRKWFALLVLLSPASWAGQKLLLVGGGERPRAALERFCDWAGGSEANVLVITWATAYPADAFQGFAQDFAFCPASRVEASPAGSELKGDVRAAFLDALRLRTAVFFTGGDQNRIMQVLAADSALEDALKGKYESGTAFGGTSAGTAIMSPLMLSGEGDETVVDGGAVGTAPGLGLLPGVVLDTHFLRRQRENRLLGVVLAHPALEGIGIDEDTALGVTDGRQAVVYGRAQVMTLDASQGGEQVRLGLHAPGSTFELSRQRLGLKVISVR